MGRQVQYSDGEWSREVEEDARASRREGGRMSNNRIDHADEARKLLAWVDRAGENSIREHGPLVVAAAQVHATLALVEQQRLANLLRSGAIGGGPMSDHYPGAVQSYLRKEWPDIAAALGVER